MIQNLPIIKSEKEIYRYISPALVVGYNVKMPSVRIFHKVINFMFLILKSFVLKGVICVKKLFSQVTKYPEGVFLQVPG